MTAAAEVDPTDGWEWSVFDSLLLAKPFEALVDVRQVVCRHVVDEVSRDLIVANTAVEPTHEDCEMRDRGKCEGAPVWIEKCVHGRRDGKRLSRFVNHGFWLAATVRAPTMAAAVRHSAEERRNPRSEAEETAQSAARTS